MEDALGARVRDAGLAGLVSENETRAGVESERGFSKDHVPACGGQVSAHGAGRRDELGSAMHF